MATTNFNFTLLAGSDEAGYNSINTLITSIDNELYDRVAVPGMVVAYDTSGSIPTGWTNLGQNPGSGLPDLSGDTVYTWIKKSV